jgi:hypothetical protein
MSIWFDLKTRCDMTHFGYGGRIPQCRGRGTQGVGGECKCRHRPLLHSVKVRGLTDMVLTP